MQGGATPGSQRAALTRTLLAGVPTYLALHALSFGRIPSGLEGGPAVEALRGVRLVLRRKFEVLTFSIGPSAETLWLYVVGAAVDLFGPHWLSVVAPSILAAAAIVTLTVVVAKRLAPTVPPAIPFMLSAGSVWLFHYGQVGLRTICAPLFLLLTVWLVDRGEAEHEGAGELVAAGLVLGLSVYAYSSCRVLPIAWAGWKALAFWRAPADRPRLRRQAFATLLGLFLALTPALLFAAREPREFLFRGYYVYRGGLLWKVANVFWTFLLPFHHPRLYTVWLGEGHNFDATAVTLTSSGVQPVDPVTALALLGGLVLVLRMPRRAGWSYLLSVYVTANLLLGITGPSLTRLLILQPVHVLFASLALGFLFARSPRLRPIVFALLVIPAGLGAWQYVSRFGASAEAQRDYLPAANAMSVRTRDLLDADSAERALLVAWKGRDIAKFYNYRHIDRVWLMEIVSQNVETDGEARRFRPTVVLVERRPDLNAFAATLGRPDRSFALFDEYRPPRATDTSPPRPGNIRRLWGEVER